MVINTAGPIGSKSQSKGWLLLKREIRNPAESDVSDASSFCSISFLVSLISLKKKT